MLAMSLACAAMLLPRALESHARELRDRGFTVVPDAGLDVERIDKARLDCSATFERCLDGVARLGVNPVEQAYFFSEISTRHRLRWEMRPSDSQPSAWTELVDDAVASVASPIIKQLCTMPQNADDESTLPQPLRGVVGQLIPKRPSISMRGAIVSRPGAMAQRFHADADDAHFSLAALLPHHRLFNVFVPLVDIEAGADGTMLWPGSHLESARLQPYLDAIHRSTHLEADEQAMGEMIAPACPAGGVLIFDYRLMHRGQPNRSSRERTLAYAIVSTGLARDGSNWDESGLESLWDCVNALPDGRSTETGAATKPSTEDAAEADEVNESKSELVQVSGA
jgi:hypothetical protein